MLRSLGPLRRWGDARRFGKALASQYATGMGAAAADRTGSKQRLLTLSMRAQVERFAHAERVTFIGKALLANEFKWGLIEAGVDRTKVDELTEWLLQEVSQRRS